MGDLTPLCGGLRYEVISRKQIYCNDWWLSINPPLDIHQPLGSQSKETDPAQYRTVVNFSSHKALLANLLTHRDFNDATCIDAIDLLIMD